VQGLCNQIGKRKKREAGPGVILSKPDSAEKLLMAENIPQTGVT
jgi:hypothetical protein